jgi:stage II sporulation protein M
MKYNKKNKIKLDKRQAIIYFVILATIIGVVIGVIMSNYISENTYDFFTVSMDNYFENIHKNFFDFKKVLWSSFFKYGSLLIVLWSLGFVPIGGIFVFLLILFKGVSYGYIIMFLYMHYGSNGFMVSTVLYLSQFTILVPIYLYIAYNSIAYGLLHSNCSNNKKSFLIYSKYLIIGIIFCFVVSFIEIIIVQWFL